MEDAGCVCSVMCTHAFLFIVRLMGCCCDHYYVICVVSLCLCVALFAGVRLSGDVEMVDVDNRSRPFAVAT